MNPASQRGTPSKLLPKLAPGTHYDFTAEERKYAAHPEHSALLVGTETLCYGVLEVIEIVRYSEPGNALGQTMTEVTYRYALRSIAPWVNNATLLKDFPELAQIKTRDHPGENHLDLVLMGDGWRVTNLGY